MKRRLAKALVGEAVFVAAITGAEKAITAKEPNKKKQELMVQMSKIFLSICFIIYGQYVVGKQS